MRKEAPADVVYEDAAVVCILPLHLAAYGHTLLITREHSSALWDTAPDALAHVLAVAWKLSIHYKARIGATGCNLLHASGSDAQQSVHHFHMHLIPRFPNDGVDAWPPLPEVRPNRADPLVQLRLDPL